MARIRPVKPSLRTSRVVASWPFEVRYFFVLLWGYLDDEGRGLDIPKTIAGDCYPLDDKVNAATINRWLALMVKPTPASIDKGGSPKPPPVCRYEVNGTRYIHCVNWHEHVTPTRPTPSTHQPCPMHPDPEFTESPSSGHGAATEHLDADSLSPRRAPTLRKVERLKVRKVERVAIEPLSESTPPPTALPGDEPMPPDRCRDHRDDPDPPACHRCRGARQRLETWSAGKRVRVDAAPECPLHVNELASNCRLCAGEAKGAA